MFISVNWNISKCSRNIHWNPDFRYFSVTFQWTFSMAGTFQRLMNCQEKNLKNVHEIRGFKVKSLWITTYEINKKWGARACLQVGSNQGIFFCTLLFLYWYVTSTSRCFISVTGQHGYIYVYILAVWTFSGP